MLALAVIGGPAASAQSADAQDQEQPLDLDIVERTERRLIQLDISLEPKKKNRDASLPQLNPTDFELVVAGKRIEIRYADRICNETTTTLRESTSETLAAPAAGDTAAIAPPRGAYLFYFEHKHMTMRGQEMALTMVEELLPKLVTGGVRGMVVSSGRKLLQSELTDDSAALLEFVGKMRKDRDQWTEFSYAENEATRYIEIIERHDDSIFSAQNLARLYQREERIITTRRLSRLRATIGSLANLDPPKAVLYFADIIRQRPGEHYLELFNIDADNQDSVVAAAGMDAFSASAAFDRVTEEAGAQGVRLYTIQAQGLVPGGLGVTTTGSSLRPDTATPTRHIRDAEDTMRSFALETGGTWFRGGTERTTLNRIVTRVRTDLSCLYVLSFYPDGLGQDQPLPVRVRFNADSPRADALIAAYDIKSRGQIVVQSEAKRRESVLLAAHAASAAVESDPGRGVVIPLGWDGENYHVLVQFAVGEPDMPDALAQQTSWDLGISHVFKEKVRDRLAQRVEVPDPRIPVVLETAWTFGPGRHEIVSVGQENRFGQLSSVTVQQEWPDLTDAPAVISPVAIVQPADGIFLRAEADGNIARRNSGSLGIGDAGARVDRPFFMVGLVCRGKRNKQVLWIDRKLVGNVSIDFDLQRWDHDEQDRCIQIRDLVREDQVGWGDFKYEVRVYEDAERVGEPLAERIREFTAIDLEAEDPGAGT